MLKLWSLSSCRVLRQVSLLQNFHPHTPLNIVTCDLLGEPNKILKVGSIDVSDDLYWRIFFKFVMHV